MDGNRQGISCWAADVNRQRTSSAARGMLLAAEPSCSRSAAGGISDEGEHAAATSSIPRGKPPAQPSRSCSRLPLAVSCSLSQRQHGTVVVQSLPQQSSAGVYVGVYQFEIERLNPTLVLMRPLLTLPYPGTAAVLQIDTSSAPGQSEALCDTVSCQLPDGLWSWCMSAGPHNMLKTVQIVGEPPPNLPRSPWTVGMHQ